MKLFSDYHLHPQGHRLQPYTQELLQPWADHARQIGLRDIALTDHDRYHPGVDFDEIDRLRAANPDLKIRAGIELDNDPVHSAAGRAWVEKNWDRLDFVLGSVHFLRGDWAFDHAGQEAEFARREIDEVYADYYERIRAMAASGLVDCMAHLDLVKIFGFRPTKDLSAVLDAVPHGNSRCRSRHGIIDRGLAQTGRRTLSERRNHPARAWQKAFPSRPRPMGIRMCSREKISSGWRKRWRRWASMKSAFSSVTRSRSWRSSAARASPSRSSQ